jgi:hypothetical protein
MHYLTNRLKRSFKSCLSISSFIQTILSASEFHRIGNQGRSRALPPVGNLTLP